MLIFGDRTERVNPRERLAAIRLSLSGISEMPAGLDRHAAIAGTLIESGRLLQGVADADFDQAARDGITPQTEALGDLVLGIAHMLCRSWDSGFQSIGDLAEVEDVASLPESVVSKNPEGFAFYSVYPEAYLQAARRLRLDGPPRVIGVRSIGSTLAPVVAAALDADVPVTVRPFGDPFARVVSIDPALERRLLAGDAHYIIVDEGPGQSGSSFGAVADWLQERGVPLERIAFLPSHAGPLGPHASAAHRMRWQSAQREVADFGDHLKGLVGEWLRELHGSLDDEPREISGGEWRRLGFANEADWPPVVAMFERRKFLVSSDGNEFVAKFAGLGSTATEKLGMARALHAAGLSPEPVGVAHGFLVERWRGDAEALRSDERPVEPVGRYIGARARLFAAGQEDGASLARLYEMARRNILLGLGEDAVTLLEAWRPKLEPLQGRVRPVCTDNRMDRHEWLQTPDGQLLKTDGVDHHQAHDLIGCEDFSWDVAGAITEFELGRDEAATLISAAEQAAGRSVDRELLEFYLIAYAAFRLGVASFGAELTRGNAAETQRLDASRHRYRQQLQHLLDCSKAPTRQESWVD
ncbi:hypothetical protein ACUXST_001295 [Sphingomonas sp. F9_3S_D5_B_2]